MQDDTDPKKAYIKDSLLARLERAKQETDDALSALDNIDLRKYATYRVTIESYSPTRGQQEPFINRYKGSLGNAFANALNEFHNYRAAHCFDTHITGYTLEICLGDVRLELPHDWRLYI